MFVKEGTRVGAMTHTDVEKQEVYFLGWGVYEGMKVPDRDDVLFMGLSLKALNIPNPCIALDNEEKVYGCECYWGPEEGLKDQFKGWTFVTVSIDDFRKEALDKLKEAADAASQIMDTREEENDDSI